MLCRYRSQMARQNEDSMPCHQGQVVCLLQGDVRSLTLFRVSWALRGEVRHEEGCSAGGLRLDPLLFERLVHAAPEFIPQPVQGTVNPRVIASQVLEGRKSSCHRRGVLRESSASNRDELRPVLHPRVCAGHYLLEAADDAYRKSSTYYLPQSRQVRFHPVVLLGAP